MNILLNVSHSELSLLRAGLDGLSSGTMDVVPDLDALMAHQILSSSITMALGFHRAHYYSKQFE
jgi:copper homeostasis protein CutC